MVNAIINKQKIKVEPHGSTFYINKKNKSPVLNRRGMHGKKH